MLSSMLRRKKTVPPNPVLPLQREGDPCPLCGNTLTLSPPCCGTKISWIACSKCGFRQEQK